MNWNKAVLVFFFQAYGNDHSLHVATVKNTFPATWKWEDIICVIPDSFAGLPCEPTREVLLSQFKPDPNTYYVVIANGATPGELGSVLLRIMRAGCACRSYVRDCNKLKELE